MKAVPHHSLLRTSGPLLFTPLLVAAGCASPGAPRPPSLHLPALVRDLTTVRSGNIVELRFTPPSVTTDGLPLRDPHLLAVVCRQESQASPCRFVALPAAETGFMAPVAGTVAPSVLLRDPLPDPLRAGTVRPIFYRVEVRTPEGRSAGYSAPAMAAAGAAPPPVTGLEAQGARTGVFLQWQGVPHAGEILLKREQMSPPAVEPRPAPRKTAGVSARGRELSLGKGSRRDRGDPGVVWLQAEPGALDATRTLDGTVLEGTHYRYTAVRRVVIEMAGTPLEVRSAPSAPVEVTWKDVFPPPAPEDLTAVGFGGPGDAVGSHAAGPYAVDLVWQPVRDLRVTGYLLWRTPLLSEGRDGAKTQLTPSPVTAPAFHDATASPTANYRYEVVAVDARGNRSAAANAVVTARQP